MTAATIQRVCPLCGGADQELFLRKEALRLARCGSCRMVYASPVEEELASGRYYNRLGVPFYLSPDKLAGDYAPVRFERELALFRRFCTGGRVLDVGCSTGGFLYQLRRRRPGAYDGLGMDVAGAALEHAESQGTAVLRAAFLDHDFGGARFAAVSFWAVLEHLVWPREFFVKAAGLLEPGGHLFALAPNLESLAVRMLGAKYRYIMPDHVNYFSAATFRRLAAAAPGLELAASGSCHFNPAVIWRDLRGGTRRVADTERAKLLKRTTAWKQNPLLKPAQWMYGWLERWLGRRGLADNLYMVLRKR